MEEVTELWLSLGFHIDEATFKQTSIKRQKRMADEVVYFRVLDSMAREIRSI